MTELTMLALMMAGVLTLLDWRKGLFICVIIGVAQDPLRKLAPNQPIYYVLLVGVIFGLAWIRAALARVPLTPAIIHGWRQHLKAPFGVFIALVLAQALHSFVRYGSYKMTGIGLLVWLAPIPAVLLAYQYTTRRGILGVRRWMLLYVGLALAALTGVFFEYVGFSWSVLGEIGEGQIIYDVGTVLKAYSGFFRASEIAAWHAATIACFVFILSVGKRPTVMRVLFALAMVALLIALGTLTGRRKMLVEVTVFLSAYVFLVAWLQRGLARFAVGSLIVGAIGYIAIVGFVAPDTVQRTYGPSALSETSKFQGYATRGQTVFADLPARVNQLGVQPIVWATESFGWLGAGLGTGSQGTGDIGQAHGINRGPSEGGLGKITMELGVPGLLMVAWLLVALGKHIHGHLVILARTSPQHARVAFGLVAYLVANAATFSVATQAYSDLFVLLILGWAMGFLLALPVLAANGDGVRRRTFDSTRPGPGALNAAALSRRALK